MEKYFADTVIVGGGSSGLMCAVSAAEKNKNKKIILIEKEEKTGRKLLATGNGRCNLTNMQAGPKNYSGSFEKGVEVLLAEYPPKKVVDCFSRLGLICAPDAEGRVYPISNHSASVLDVLNLAVKRLDVNVFCGAKVTGITKNKRKFTVVCGDFSVICENVVVCCGGKSNSRLGSDGSIYPVLQKLGHKIIKPKPSLCQLLCSDKELKQLHGIRWRGKASFYDGGSLMKEEYGEIQFTENALSGICIFNLSECFYTAKKPVLRLSLIPDVSMDKIMTELKRRRILFAAENPENFFTGMFHKKIAAALISKAHIDSEHCCDISDRQLEKLCEIITAWDFRVVSTAGFENSQVTSGGVWGEEIDENTFESRLVKNLFFCGEVIDVNGECGGYNLQFAFSSAIKVGNEL